MVDYPVISATDATPVVLEEVQVTSVTKTFNRWWLQRVVVRGIEPNEPVTVNIVFVKGCKDENGVWELSPRPEDTMTVHMDDLFAMAETDSDVAQAIGAIMGIAVKYATIEGKL